MRHKIHLSLFLLVLIVPALSSVASAMTGAGTEGDPYIIGDVTDLQAMNDSRAAWYRLGGDIDASATSGWNANAGFVPIGDLAVGFTGNFNGMGFSVTDLFVDRDSTDFQGLIGRSAGGVVTSVTVFGTITGSSYTGGVVGSNESGTISDCAASVTVTGSYYAGGVAGRNYGTGAISDCSSTGTITISANSSGGIAGYSEGSVVDCSSVATVAGDRAGGVVGLNGTGGIVSSSSSSGAVSGADYIGGVVGWNNIATVTSCSATGSVTGTDDYAGGVIGRDSGSVTLCFSSATVIGVTLVGGVSGQTAGTVTSCYASSTVTGRGAVGGVIGRIDVGVVTDCFSTGDVYRSSGENATVGGCVGTNNRGTLSRCYSTGNVYYTGATDPTDKGFYGTIVEGDDLLMAYNFWDSTVSNQATGPEVYATLKTTTQMKQEATFTTWDFTDVWWITESQTYPQLRTLSSVSSLSLPSTPSTPVPADGATDQSVDVDLGWSGGVGAASFTLYFGSSSPPVLYASEIETAAYTLPELSNATTYYWQIVALNADGNTTSSVWDFETEAGVTPASCRSIWVSILFD